MPSVAQLTVRIPDDLRRAVKRKALSEGTSVQAFVERTLRTAVEPDVQISHRSADELLEFIRSGAYDEIAQSIGDDDPDLATM